MPEALVAGCLVIVWLAVTLRIPGARRSPDRLTIMLALAAGVTSITFEYSKAGTWVTTVTGSVTLPFVVQVGGAVFAMSGVTAWAIYAWRAQGRPAWWARERYPFGAALLVITALAVIAFSYDLKSTSTYAAVGEQHARWPDLAFLGLYETFECILLGTVAVLFWRLARARNERHRHAGQVSSQADELIAADDAQATLTLTGQSAPLDPDEQEKWVRICLLVMGAASLGSTSRSLYTLAYLLPQVVGTPIPGIAWSAEFSKYVNLPFNTVGIIGISLPALGRAHVWARPRWALRVLTPLWEDISGVFPLVRVRGDTAKTELRLRTVVVHDGLLLLREHSSPEALAEARAWAQATVAPPERREAAAVARWSILTLASLGPDPQPRYALATWPLSSSARDPDWLLEVAQEYARLRRRPHLLQEVLACQTSSAMDSSRSAP
ncbi:DUF6545 domain-containing protein [Nonomuraea sp. NPDC003707]